MPEIKIKPKMTAPKVRKTNVAPKEATDILRKRYTEQEKARQPEPKDPVQYATDQTETGGGRGAALAADGTRRAARAVKQRRESQGHTTDNVPKKEDTPSVQTHTAPKTRGSQTPDKPAFAPKDRSFVERRSRMERNGATGAIRRVRELNLRRQAIRKHMAKQAKETAVRVAEVASGAVKSTSSSVAALGGGAVLVVVVVVIALIAAAVASPFGVFFADANATTDAVPVTVAAARVNSDFNALLEDLQRANPYDNITLDGSTADWTEVLAVFAARVAGADNGTDVATLDADRIERLKAVFFEMNPVTTEEETIDHPDSDPGDGTDDSWTERNLYITLTPKTAEDMASACGFTARQTDAMNELLAERAMLTELLGSLTAYSADAADIMKRLPDDLSPERRAVVEAACSLVGKVNYYWGGKSLVLGWDERWGTLQKVTADGNSTTGTYRPYGLDCSGFVDWIFYNASDGSYIIGHGSGATMQHHYCTAIPWADAQPGDLVFYPDDSHVGIVGGRNARGNLRIIHCASGANGTVVTDVGGFTAIGRPLYYNS